MSRHIGRKEQWTEISPTRHDGIYGYVEQNQHGRWDAFLVYQKRTPLESIVMVRGTMALRQWRKATKPCGEFKRAREAMMAVEQKAKEMKAENNEDILI